MGDTEKKIHRYWLEAEETRHQVGAEQRETIEERQDAIVRGKATSSVIGTHAMGQRFNVLMTIQLPLKQKPCVTPRGMPLGMGAFTLDGFALTKERKTRRKKEAKKKKRKEKSLSDDDLLDLQCTATRDRSRSPRRRAMPTPAGRS